MRDYLLEQISRYPDMQVEDAVKLLYQSEFGGGHMIANPQKSLNWIREEWEQVKESLGVNGEERPVIEAIGGGMCRVHLDAFAEGLAPETLNQMFVQTADRKQGDPAAFEQKLGELLNRSIRGELPFSPEDVRSYLARYRAEGCPPVSHSETYRRRYHPSYRVVAEYYTRFYPVFLKIDQTLAAKKEGQVVVSIDGMCGSGKSTLGRILKEIYGCSLFHMDDFFLRPEQRTRERLEEPGGNVDYERFQEEILSRLGDRNGLSYQIYDCQTQSLTERVTVPWSRLVIIEGAYSRHPFFGDPYDLRFFMKLDKDEQERRILKRNGPRMLERFRTEWIPMENKYFKAYQIEETSLPVQ